jgi:thioredoxin 1
MKNNEFQKRIKNSHKPIIVDLWAPWCAPCRSMAPAFKQISQKYDGQVDVLKINVDESPEIMKVLGVMSIPTLIGFAKGEEILRRSGMQTQGMLEFFFDTTISQKKPILMPPAPATRIFRTMLGLAVVAFGWFSDQSLLIMIIGGIVVFSGYYDRCPIVKAIAPRLKALFQRSKKAES